MNKLKKLAVTMTLCLGVLALPLHANAKPQPLGQLDKVAVVVNNGVILDSEINNMMKAVKSNAAKARQQLPDDKTLRQQVIERLVNDSIVIQLAEMQGFNVNDEQLEQAITSVARQNNLSLAQMKNTLQADGISYEAYKNQFRKDMILNEVRNSEVRRRVIVSPQEVDMLAKEIKQHQDSQVEYNLSHILLFAPESMSKGELAEVESKARDIIREVNKGASFAKLAATHSIDPQALNGGAMGWAKIEELPPQFANIVQGSRAGSTVGPVRSRVGYHIIRINNVRKIESPKVMTTEVHARHILIKPTVILTDAQAKQKIENVRQDIQSGKMTFEQAAKQFSEDPGSALQGGDLGWANPQIFDPAFRSAVTSLSKGQTSSPIRSSFGWHIIELLDTKQIDATDQAYKDQAYRILFNQRFNEETQIWLQEERAMAYVKVIEK